MNTESDYETSGFDNESDEFENNREDIGELKSEANDDLSEALDTTGFNDNSSVAASELELIENISYTDPEIMLTKLQNINVDRNFDVSRISKIQCLALCRIVYGERHWKVAEAHVQLANVYLKGKQYHQQVLKHTNIARDILLAAHKGDPSDESKREYLLQNMYYLMGRVNYNLSKHAVAENLLMKAKLVADHSENATSIFLKMKVSILSSLASTLSKRNQEGQAIEYIEEGIEVANKLSGSDKTSAIDLHKQIVNIELKNGKNGNISFAVESALKALELSSTYNGKDSKETADIYVLMSRLEILNDNPAYENIENHLNKALEIFTTLENTSKIIHTMEMISKLHMKQEKFSLAKSVLKEAINICEKAYGDMSVLSAELYDLLGNILFAENRMQGALSYFSKAEETFNGRTKYQERHSKIIKLIQVIKKSQNKNMENTMKGKPLFS